MSKSRVDGTSDYGKLLQECREIKKDVPMNLIIEKLKRLDEVHTQIKEAEDALNKTLDLINSSEELAYFNNEKKTIRKPIEEYFKRWKK
jgi:hypothetical protein